MELLINFRLMLRLFEEVANEKVLVLIMKEFDQDYFLMYNDEHEMFVRNDDEIEEREYNEKMMKLKKK